jgi:hypothetical protein
MYTLLLLSCKKSTSKADTNNPISVCMQYRDTAVIVDAGFAEFT